MEFDFQRQIESKSEQELMDIYINAGSFQERFIQLAEEELKKRNVPIDHLKQIRSEKQKVADDVLYAGRQGSPLFIALAFGLALLGGIPAMVAGYIYNQSKHTNSQGDKFYVYNESTRKAGGWIIALGFTVCMIALFIKMQQ